MSGPARGAPSPDRSTAAKLWAPCIMVLVTVVGWLLLLPWDWSTVDANGRRTDRGDVWSGLFFLAVLIGLAIAIVVRRYPASILTAPLTAVAAMSVLYSWRASQARVIGSNAWVFGLIGVVIPLGLLGAFGGAFLAIRSNRRAGGRDE